MRKYNLKIFIIITSIFILSSCATKLVDVKLTDGTSVTKTAILLEEDQVLENIRPFLIGKGTLTYPKGIYYPVDHFYGLTKYIFPIAENESRDFKSKYGEKNCSACKNVWGVAILMNHKTGSIRGTVLGGGMTGWVGFGKIDQPFEYKLLTNVE